MKYRVYFEQVNAQYIEVEADSEDKAVDAAETQWARENCPDVRLVEGSVVELDK